MQPVITIQQFIQVDFAEIVFCKGTVFAVISNFARADPIACFQIVGSKPVRGCFLRGTENHGCAVYIIAPEHAHGTFSETVIGDNAEKSAVHAEIGECQCNIGLTSAIAGFKSGGNADFVIVWRGQAKHDLADGKKFFCIRTV